MPALSPKRKQRAVPFKTSALESARRAGIAGVFSGPPDLAANRKKYLKEKLTAPILRSTAPRPASGLKSCLSRTESA